MESRSLRAGAVVLLLASLVRTGAELTLPGDPVLPQEGESLQALEDASQAALEEKLRREAPLAPGETIDPNRASEAELDRLPGVGPATAREIVAERVRGGGFRSPDELLRVKGIGEKTLERFRDRLDLREGIPAELTGGSGSAAAGRRAGPRIDVNSASEEELVTLPGIGPALARRIIERRRARGPFQVQADLLEVRGIGRRTLARISDQIRIGKRFP